MQNTAPAAPAATADEIVAQIEREHGRAMKNRAVKIHNNARKGTETAASLRELAAHRTGDLATALQLAAELLAATTPSRG